LLCPLSEERKDQKKTNGLAICHHPKKKPLTHTVSCPTVLGPGVRAPHWEKNTTAPHPLLVVTQVRKKGKKRKVRRGVADLAATKQWSKGKLPG